jgi:hypothetical protein
MEVLYVQAQEEAREETRGEEARGEASRRKQIGCQKQLFNIILHIF